MKHAGCHTRLPGFAYHWDEVVAAAARHVVSWNFFVEAHASRRVRVEDLTADPGAVARGLCADFLRAGAHCPDAAAFAAAAETLASDVNAHGRGTNRTRARKGWAARPGSKPFLDAVDRGRPPYRVASSASRVSRLAGSAASSASLVASECSSGGWGESPSAARS